MAEIIVREGQLDFPVLNSNFEARVRASFEKQLVMGTFGAEMNAVEPGFVRLSLPFGTHLTQQHGFLHGGVVAAMLDSACGYAAMTLMPEDAEVLTVEFKTNFLSPAAGEMFTFEGRVLKPGRTLIVAEGEARADKLIAKMTATLMVVQGRADVSPQTGT